MSANISDKFNKASNMGGNYPPVATVSSARAASGSTLSCDDLSGWATDTPVHFSTFKVNADGTIDTSTQTDWKGIVVGNTITEMTRLAGAADSGNASGDKVELNPTIGWVDDLMSGILVSHKQDGKLKDNIVKATNIDFTTLIDKIYPVGSVYMSTNNVSPATFIGGTWTQIKDTFLLSAGDTYTAGDTGGEATHTLTKDEMPSHTHSVTPYAGTNGSASNADVYTNGGAGAPTYRGVSGSSGGDQAHNNMPPYLVVYMWKRTA